MASKLEFKFRFIWIDDNGTAFGTNDKETAEHFEEHFEVIDAHRGEILGTGEILVEAEMPDEDEEEE